MSLQIPPNCIGPALVDGDIMALAHLEFYFSDVEDFTVLTATCSLRIVLRFVQSHQVDVLITDVHMERVDGVEMTWEVLHLSPSAWVVLLTTVDIGEDLLQSLGARTNGFLFKGVPAEEIIAAVRTIHSGAKVVAPVLTVRLTNYALTSVRGADGSVHLSQRERDVLHLLCGGVSNHKIASLPVIAEAAVRSHITGLLHKTGTASRLEIMVWAFKHGYASSSPTTIPAVSAPNGLTPGSIAP